jgi:site-specific recombinase XerD
MKLTDACLYQRKDSPYWWIKYWSEERMGWHQRGTEHRRDDPQGYKRALATARELSAEGRAARQVVPTSRWSSWVTDWLKQKHHDSPKTLVSELGRWHWIDAFLTERKVRGPQGMNYLLGQDYMSWRTSQTKRVSKKHPCHNTALMELRLLSRALQEAVHRGYIFANPLARINIKKHKAAEKPELTDADVSAIRAALAEREGQLPLKDRWMTICFEIALHQGCRVSETSVALTDIDENAFRITFHAKRDNVFTTKLNAALVPMIRQLRAARVERTCILPVMLTKEWHWFFKGRPERGWVGVCPHVTFHCTRVTVITRMARAGVPIQQAMAFVGHADESVHRIYQRLQADDLSRCTDALQFSPSSGIPQSQGAGGAKLLAAGQ